MTKITYKMSCRPCWNNIALEYCLVNVVQICLRQHCTRKLLAQCWLKAHSYTLAEKSAVSNMSGSLVLIGYYITEQFLLFLFNVGSGVQWCKWNIWWTYVKRVRDSDYVTTSAIWDHLNIFVIMRKLYHVHTCSKPAT